MNFGKYTILEKARHQFREEPELWWEIKPPTSGDELDMARFLNRGKITLGFEGTSREAGPTLIEIAHHEIALLFAGTNIAKTEKPVGEGGEPILGKDATPADVEAMLRLMPHDMVMEIWEAIGEMVPQWGGRSPKACVLCGKEDADHFLVSANNKPVCADCVRNMHLDLEEGRAVPNPESQE